MPTISSIANSKTGYNGRPISLRDLFGKLQAQTAKEAISSYWMNDFHRRTGGPFGPLGPPIGTVTKLSDGSYQRQFQLGITKMQTLDSPVQAQTLYLARVMLGAMKCFGTFSSTLSSTDSTYAVITLISLNPNAQGSAVITMRTPVQDNVSSGTILFEVTPIGDSLPTGTGIAIHLALWRHFSGDPDTIANKVHDVINAAIDKAAAAIAAGSSAADDTSVSGGAVGDITQWSIGGVKPIDVLTLGLANLIADVFADKLIGQQVYPIPAENIIDLSDQQKFTESIYQSPDLTPDIQVNWLPLQDPNPIFSGGGATYKAYWLIKGIEEIIPTTPSLS